MSSAIRVAVCDDDAVFLDIMTAGITAALDRPGVSLELKAYSAGAPLLADGAFDLVFLDIDMPEMDGIRCAQRLRAAGSEADIVFVSQMEDRVFGIFEVHPWCFIRKSRFREEAPAVLHRWLDERRVHSEVLLFTGEHNVTRSVRPEDILYAESAGKTQKLFLSGSEQPFVIRGLSFHELEEQLETSGFIRIHKGFLANYRYICRITSRSILLDGDISLPVGRDRLTVIREKYLALMKSKTFSV